MKIMKGMRLSFESCVNIPSGICSRMSVKNNEGYGTFIIVLITTSDVVNNDEQLFRGRVFNK